MASRDRIDVKVRLFAQCRSLAGTGAVPVSLLGDATCEEAVNVVIERFPVLREFVGEAAFAVDGQYCRRDRALKHGDELAWIPPVSGG